MSEITIKKMGIVGRGLSGKFYENNSQLKLNFKTIRKNLWRRRKSSPICVQHFLYTKIQRQKNFLANIIKTISDTLKQEQFVELNSIVGRHSFEDVLFVNKNHHFGFPIQLEDGHIAMIPFVNELSVDEISDCIKDCISFLKQNEKQWLYIANYELLQKRDEWHWPTFAITDWYSIELDGGFLPLPNFSAPPITFGYTKEEIFVIYDHLFFSGAIIEKFLHAIKEKLEKWQ